MIHIGDISREKRLNHPNEVLKVGQTVKAQVLEADKERRRIRLGIKQLEPTSIDEYIAEHKAGDSVSGRLVDVSGQKAKVELGEGVFAWTKIAERTTGESSRQRGQSGSGIVDGDAFAALEIGRRRRRRRPRKRPARGRSAVSRS